MFHFSITFLFCICRWTSFSFIWRVEHTTKIAPNYCYYVLFHWGDWISSYLFIDGIGQYNQTNLFIIFNEMHSTNSLSFCCVIVCTNKSCKIGVQHVVWHSGTPHSNGTSNNIFVIFQIMFFFLLWLMDFSFSILFHYFLYSLLFVHKFSNMSIEKWFVIIDIGN